MRWDIDERPADVSAWVATGIVSTVYVWAIILAQLFEWVLR